MSEHLDLRTAALDAEINGFFTAENKQKPIKEIQAL